MSFGARASRGIAAALGLILAAPAAAGEVKGTVSYAGAAPRLAPFKANKDMKICGDEVPNESLEVSGGKLENVVVTVEGASSKAPARTVTVDQKRCRYVPHVQATGVGSDLDILNSDGVLHNIHGYLGAATIFNLAMPLKNQKITRKLAKPGLVHLKCDVHSWMGGYIVVTDAPAAVSDKGGRFAIRDLPAGSYTVKAWHETLGEKSAQVTVPASGEATVTFTFGK